MLLRSELAQWRILSKASLSASSSLSAGYFVPPKPHQGCSLRSRSVKSGVRRQLCKARRSSPELLRSVVRARSSFLRSRKLARTPSLVFSLRLTRIANTPFSRSGNPLPDAQQRSPPPFRFASLHYTALGLPQLWGARSGSEG